MAHASFVDFMESDAVAIVAVIIMCIAAFVSAIVVSLKGRSRLWCIPCVLFPPFLLVLFRLRPGKRAGQFQCPCCELWNPVERERCVGCGEVMEHPDFVA